MTRMPKSKSYGKKRHMWILKGDHLFSWKISSMYKRLQTVQQNTYLHSLLLASFKNIIWFKESVTAARASTQGPGCAHRLRRRRTAPGCRSACWSSRCRMMNERVGYDGGPDEETERPVSWGCVRETQGASGVGEPDLPPHRSGLIPGSCWRWSGWPSAGRTSCHLGSWPGRRSASAPGSGHCSWPGDPCPSPPLTAGSSPHSPESLPSPPLDFWVSKRRIHNQ